MSGTKITFLIMLMLAVFFIVLQQFGISELKKENSEVKEKISRMEKDISLIGKVFLSEINKDSILANLKQNDSELKIVEYDLGSVKMRGIDLNFDKDGKLKSISARTY